MAISEEVRLAIRIEDGSAAARQLTRLSDEVERLKAAFQESGVSVRQTTSQIVDQFGNAVTAAEQRGAQFQQATRQLRVPNSVLEVNRQAAQQISRTLNQTALSAVESAQTFQQGARQFTIPNSVLRQTRGQAQALRTEFLNTVNAVNQGQGRLGASSRQAANQFTAQNEVTKRANLLLIDFSRLAQDSAFGVRAIVNNLDPLILNTQRYAAAVQAAGRQTGIFVGVLRGLSRAAIPIFIIVNLVFALTALTDIFDPLVEKIKSFTDSLKDAADAQEELRERIEENIGNFRELDDAVTLQQALRELELINAQLDLLDARGEKNLFDTIFGAAALGPGTTGAARAAISAFQATGDAIDEETERLEGLAEEYTEITEDFEAFLLNIEDADPNVVSNLQQEVADKLEEGKLRLLEIRRDAGDRSLELEREIERERVDVQTRALRTQQENLIGLFRELGRTRGQLLTQLLQAQDQAARERALTSLDTLDRFRGQILERAQQIGTIIDALFGAIDAEIAQKQAQAARDRQRQIVDIAFETAELRTRATQRGVGERISLLQIETERRREELERQLADFNRQFGENEEFTRAIREQQRLLTQLLTDDIEAIYAEQAANIREFQNQVLALDRSFLQELGASRERLIELQLERVRSERDALSETEDNAERLRELTLEQIELEQQLQLIRAETARQDQQRLSRQQRFQSELLRRVQQSQAEIAARSETAFDEGGQLAIIEARADLIRAEIDEARRQASGLETLYRELAEARRVLAETEPETQAREDAAGVVRGLEDQVDAAEIASDRYQELLFDQVDVAQSAYEAELRIYQRRQQTIEQFTNVFLNSIRAQLARERQFTETEIALQRRRFDAQENELAQSLGNREISQRQYNLEVKRLAEERAEFTRRVEEDRASAIERVLEDLTEAVIREGLRRLAAFIAQETARALFAESIAKAAAAATIAQMQAIAASAGAAAGAVSIATFGAAAASGTAAALAGISSVAATTQALAAVPGFYEGGRVRGRQGRDKVPARLTSGEFVFTRRAVGGRFDVMYALMDALEKGLDADMIMSWLRGAGIKAHPMRTTRAMGLHFQEGGAVPELSGSINTFSIEASEGVSSKAVVSELRTLRTEVRDLRREIVVLAERPAKAVVDQRETRTIQREAQELKRLKRPS